MGRDFVVGDLHGMFNSLEVLLDRLSFNPEIDRVFSVGDLIDRGEQSNRIGEFLNKPWFTSVMGNHEGMLLDARVSQYSLHNWIKYNGGAWWKTLSKKEQDKIYHSISKLPYLLEIKTAIGNVGVAHADLPVDKSWSEIVRAVSTDDEMKNHILWSRHRHKKIRRTQTTSPIEGIDLAVMGHTPYKKVLHRENVFYIDTGATYKNDTDLSNLTLLQIHPTLEIHQHSTYQERSIV